MLPRPCIPRTPTTHKSRYPESFLILLPGFLAVLLFPIASGATRSIGDRHGLYLPVNGSHTKLSAAPRLPIFLSAENSATAALDTFGNDRQNEHFQERLLRLTSSPTPLNCEEMSLEVPLTENGPRADQFTDLKNAVPQILARRMRSADLRMTLRAAPENLVTVIDIAQTAVRNSSLSGDRIAVGADSGISPTVMRIEISRFVQPVMPEETEE